MKSARRMLEFIALATLIAIGAFKAWSMLAAGGDASASGSNLNLSGDGLLLVLGLGGLCVIALAALGMWMLRGRSPAVEAAAREDIAAVETRPTRSATPGAPAKWRGHAQPKPGVFGRRAER